MNKKTWPVILLFLLVMFGTAQIAFLYNDSTPVYESGTLLSPADGTGIMTVRGMYVSEDGQTLILKLCTQAPAGGLALMISNANPVTVWQDGRQIYSQNLTDTFHRSQVIQLGDFSAETTVRIRSETVAEPLEYRILLGSFSYIQNKLAFVLSWNTFLSGLLTMMFVSALILYVKKRSEQYLLHISIASLLSLINLSLVYGIFGLSGSFEKVMSIRSTALLLCSLQIFRIIQQLFPKNPGRLSVLTARIYTVLIYLAAPFVLLGLLPSSTGYYARLLILPASLSCFAGAVRVRRSDALVVLAAYGIMEGLCLMSFVGAYHLYYGELLGFWRIMEAAQILFLAVSSCIVYMRFAERFRQAERLQADLTELNATLEDRVAIRTKELKDQQERQRTTMQNIFHDLRSPLYVLQSQVKKLPDTDDNKTAREVLQSRLHYMRQLTEDLFLIANLENHNIIFDEDEVDMAAVVSEISREMQPVAAEKGVSLTVNVSGSCPVWGDPFRLRQALQNLADNALQHTTPGTYVNFSVSEAEDRVMIAVHNTGKPIPKEHLPLIFQRYYRSKKTRDSQSSGLGLSIAKEIIEAHEGQVWVESDEARGTVFTVSLPPL